MSLKRTAVIGILALISFPRVHVRAEVLSATAGGFSIRDSVEIAAPAPRVYETLIKPADWWSSSHTYSGNSKNLSLDAVAGGCFCERWEGGRTVQHMTIVNVEPGKTLRLTGALGPLQQMGVAGVLTFSLTEADGRTRFEATYNVGGYAPDGLNQLAPMVDKVLLEQITRLKHSMETVK